MAYLPQIDFLTDFADQAVIIPIVAVMALVLWRSGWRRGALAWCAVAPATLLAVGLAKWLIFHFGSPACLPGLLSPSGHTASAGLVYGGLLAFWLPARAPWQRAMLAAAPLAALIGVTRLLLDVHTDADVVVGGLFGVVGAIGLARCAGARPASVSAWPPLVSVIIVVLLFHGIRLPAEAWLHAAARR